MSNIEETFNQTAFEEHPISPIDSIYNPKTNIRNIIGPGGALDLKYMQISSHYKANQ